MESLLNPGRPLDFTKAIDTSILKGRTALVTGGASGIGLAIVKTLVEAGAKVTIADLNEENAKKAIASIQTNDQAIEFVRTDVTSWDDQFAAFDHAASTSPSKTVDMVVTSAGLEGKLSHMPSLHTLDKPIKPPTTVFDVNLTGTYYSAILALWYFAHSPPNPAKQLLFLCSLAGYASPPHETLEGDYEASKFGVRGLFQSLHPRAKGYGGARINMLCPTFTDTPLLPDGVIDRLRAAAMKTATVEDVVQGVLRCLSDEDVHGRSVVIAGGEANGGEPGSANFDVCDSVVDGFGGKMLMENMGKMVVLPES